MITKFKNPQTFALNITKNIKQIGENGCLAMCYMYCMGIDEDYYIGLLNDAINDGAYKSGIDKDCWVADAPKFIKYLSGRNVSVTKENIDIKKIKGPYPVRFSYNKKSHWVVVKNGVIVFNSLECSNCVANGKPVDLPAPDGPAVRVINFL